MKMQIRLVLLGPEAGPVTTWGLGGPALRVGQIGRKLHTAPYGPEQKCRIYSPP